MALSVVCRCRVYGNIEPYMNHSDMHIEINFRKIYIFLERVLKFLYLSHRIFFSRHLSRMKGAQCENILNSKSSDESDIEADSSGPSSSANVLSLSVHDLKVQGSY